MTVAARAAATVCRRIRVRGQVQGVGFRPFVYRLAQELDLAGWVRNDGEGVDIEAQGAAEAVEALIARVETDAPPLASVTSVEASESPLSGARGFEIKVSLHGTAAVRVAGEATLEQALLNLFNNAADAGDGRIEIEAEWSTERLRVDIRDRGPGFDEKVLLAAGRAFVTTRTEGTGIGLFLAHAAVERLGGRIALASREGGGAVTRIELPLEKIRAGKA